jgi:germination protein M
MLYQRIAIMASLLIVILMLYLIPTNKTNEIDLTSTQHLEYIYPNDLEVIYLLDNNDYLSMTKISVSNKDIITKAKSLIDAMTINGTKKDKIPNGFKSLIPENTKVLDISLKDNILTINFSKELYNTSKEDEQKLIEALTYTLTSIDGINKISIYVEGAKLIILPKSKIIIPEYLDKKYGINKQYEITTLSDIDSYTIYYVLNYNDETYYTPVTKYINNQNQDKVRIIIEELATSIVHETNLMSYLDSNVKLLDYEITDKVIKLNFNDLILSDITNNLILEEVMYTIGLSMCEELDITDVIFQVNGKEISTFSIKTLD